MIVLPLFIEIGVGNIAEQNCKQQRNRCYTNACTHVIAECQKRIYAWNIRSLLFLISGVVFFSSFSRVFFSLLTFFFFLSGTIAIRMCDVFGFVGRVNCNGCVSLCVWFQAYQDFFPYLLQREQCKENEKQQ